MNKKGVTSIQRIIVAIFLLDLTIALVIFFALTGEIDNEGTGQHISQYTNWSGTFSERINSETDDIDRLQLNPSFGDAKASGKSVWEIFKEGVDTEGLGDNLGEDTSLPYKYWMVTAVSIFLLIIHILAALEAYFVFINRKYT